MRICIDGSIGAGKSTVIKNVVAPLGIPFHLEPVERWTSLLELMYGDQQRWAMTFNMCVLLTMNEFARNDVDSGTSCVVYERSPLSCRYVFSELQHEMGFMTEEEMGILQKAFDQTAWVPDVLIFIKTTADVAYTRMIQRDRHCESQVELSYLQQLSDKYDSFLLRIRQNHPRTSIFVVDGNRDSAAVNQDVKDIINRLIT
jgi:deoxyadenosine/deoxycytidine kinase